MADTPKFVKPFVYWTGMSDFLVGAATMVSAVFIAMNIDMVTMEPIEGGPVVGQFVPLMTLGMFLMMAAALLMWSSHDMPNRAPVMFWQGLVRLTAVASIIYAVPNQLSYSFEYFLLCWDGPIGLVYIWGAMKATDRNFLEFLTGKVAPQ